VARPLIRAGLLVLALAQPVARASAQPSDLFLPASFGPPPPALLTELERDHVLIEDGDEGTESREDHGATRALVLFQQPRAEVLRLLASTPRQKEYRPELSRLEVIEASEKGDVVEYRVSFMLTTLRYRARHGWDFAKGLVWWSLDPSFHNDMRVLDGLWELRALDPHRTLGRFSTRIDLGPALPAFLQEYATRKKLPESMDAVRHWVDSLGSWRP
jgi:hypothetical protein